MGLHFFFCWRSSVLIVLPACENQVALLLKMLITPLWSKRKTSQKDQFRSYGQFELPVHVICVEVCCISEVCEAVKRFGFVRMLNFVWKSTFAWKLSFVWKYHLFFWGGGGGEEFLSESVYYAKLSLWRGQKLNLQLGSLNPVWCLSSPMSTKMLLNEAQYSASANTS